MSEHEKGQGFLKILIKGFKSDDILVFLSSCAFVFGVIFFVMLGVSFVW